MSPPTLDQLIAWRLSRRDALKLGAATGLVSLLGLSQSACSTLAKGSGKPTTLSFKGVPISAADTVVVPEGYTSQLFFAWGDPISDGPAYKPDASNSAAEQAVQAGMHHDGMNFFPLPLV